VESDSGDTDARPRRDKPAVLTVSLTVVRPNDDLPLPVYEAVCDYIKHATRAGCACTERGDAFKHLHVQGVFKQRSTSSRKLKSELVAWLQEHVSGYADLNCSVCLKKAANKGLHTWEGLLGYARKYKGRADYRELLHNVSPLELQEGDKLMRLHGSALKHRVALTSCGQHHRTCCHIS
jgi:hypothetical protein